VAKNPAGLRVREDLFCGHFRRVAEARESRLERPAIWQKLVEPGDGMGGDPREHILEPGKRVHLYQFTEATKLRSTAAVLPPRSLPKNVQLFRMLTKYRGFRARDKRGSRRLTEAESYRSGIRTWF
jgi:hypothetical protein